VHSNGVRLGGSKLSDIEAKSYILPGLKVIDTQSVTRVEHKVEDATVQSSDRMTYSAVASLTLSYPTAG